MRTAYLIWVPIWLAVLIFQTIVLNWTEEDALDWAYPVVQIAIFGVGLAAVWLAQVVRKLGIVAANLLDELLGVLAADEHLERITEREVGREGVVDTFHRFLHDVIVHAPLGLSTPGLMLKVGYPEHSADRK